MSIFKRLTLIALLACSISPLFSQSFDMKTINNIMGKKEAETEPEEKEASVGNDIPIDTRLKNSDMVNIAMTTPSYMVTAGDVYKLTILNGNSPISYLINVDTTYKIRVANLAVLKVNNTSYLSLKKQVEEIVTKNYPMSGVQFTLVSPGTFNVVLKGEIDRVKEEEVWALTRLSEVVERNMNDYTSIRNITIKRDGKKYTYDLFKCFRDGDFSQNPYLRPGDEITLNTIDRRVTIEGAVKREGTYELLKGENLKELVEIYAGGLTPLADTSRIQITKLLGKDDKTSEETYLSSVDETYSLNNYDSVYIGNYKELKSVVFIEGAISQGEDAISLAGSSKVSIRFDKGMNYATLVRENQELFNEKSNLRDAYIRRGNERIHINLEPLLYDKSFYSDEEVQPFDTLLIPSNQLYVSVTGAVAIPGRYPYIPDRTYDYYIGLAGGIISEKNSFDALTITNNNGKVMEKKDVIMPDCTIKVKSNSFTYYFNQYAPIITTLLGIITTSVSLGVMATRGN